MTDDDVRQFAACFDRAVARVLGTVRAKAEKGTALQKLVVERSIGNIEKALRAALAEELAGALETEDDGREPEHPPVGGNVPGHYGPEN